MAYSIINTGRQQAGQAISAFDNLARIEQQNQYTSDQIEAQQEAQQSQAIGSAAGMGLKYGMSDAGQEMTGQVLNTISPPAWEAGGQNAVQEVVGQEAFATGAGDSATTAALGEGAGGNVALGDMGFAAGAESGVMADAGATAVTEAIGMEAVGAVGAEAAGAGVTAATTGAATAGTAAAGTAAASTGAASAAGAAAGPLAAMGPIGWAAAAALLASQLF